MGGAAAGEHGPVADADDAFDDYITELILEEARMKDPAYQRQYSSYVSVTNIDRPSPRLRAPTSGFSRR